MSSIAKTVKGSVFVYETEDHTNIGKSVYKKYLGIIHYYYYINQFELI